jgi:hypothetical protein
VWNQARIFESGLMFRCRNRVSSVTERGEARGWRKLRGKTVKVENHY